MACEEVCNIQLGPNLQLEGIPLDLIDHILLTRLNSTLYQLKEEMRAIHATQQAILTKLDGSPDGRNLKKDLEGIAGAVSRLQIHVDAMKVTTCFKGLEEEEHIIPKSLADLAEFPYHAYILGRKGLFRANIPLSGFHEGKLETIFRNSSKSLPYHMGLFSHHHKVYMVGGRVPNEKQYSPSIYMFDPNRLPKLPITDPSHLAKPKEMSETFKLMVDPQVINSGDRVYFLSLRNCFTVSYAPFDFQSFDLTKNHFETLESPPYIRGRGAVSGFFSLRDYIYLFIKGILEPNHAYIFHTQSSKWKEHNLDQFAEKYFPIPDHHIGDVGLSDEFLDKSQILITLNAKRPTAYHIQLHDDGSLSFKSYRFLNEVYIHRRYRAEREHGRLLDIGQGRFCVAYWSSCLPLLIYVFKIDYKVEHCNQISEIKSNHNPSSKLLSSMKFSDDPFDSLSIITALCLAPATSSEGRDMEKNVKSKSHRRRRGGKTSTMRN